MFVRIPLYLKRAAYANAASEEIASSLLERLGYRVRIPDLPSGGTEVDITVGGQTSRVKCGSTDHYRLLARKNVNPLAQDSTLREIELYTIFYGASSNRRSQIFLTQVNAGEMTLWLHHEKLDEVLPFAETVVSRLLRHGRDLFHFGLGHKHPKCILELGSDKSATTIARGQIRHDGVRHFLNGKKVEVTALCLAVVFFFVTFIINGKFESKHSWIAENLPKWMSAFSEKAWPTTLLTSLTLLATLGLSYWFRPIKSVHWNWYE